MAFLPEACAAGKEHFSRLILGLKVERTKKLEVQNSLPRNLLLSSLTEKKTVR